MEEYIFPDGVQYGSIYEMGRESWWELNEKGDRSIPPTPNYIFRISMSLFSDDDITLTAILFNDSDDEIEIPIFPSPSIFVSKIIESEYVTYQGPVSNPRIPPPPHVLIVPANTSVEFVNTIDLGQYKYDNAKRIEVDWAFMTWHGEDRVKGKEYLSLEEID